jgi:hypothetical protein
MSLSVDWLAEQVKADFQARGIVAEVLYGTEKDVHAKPGPRVIIGLDPNFEIGPPAGPNAPGVKTLPGGTEGARSLMSRLQGVFVSVKTPPPDGSTGNPERSKLAHQLCAALLHETLAAIYRVAHGSVSFGSAQWQGVETADFQYPAHVKFRCVLAIPVLDIRWPKVTIEQLTTKVYAVDPGDGSETLDAETPPPSP